MAKTKREYHVYLWVFRAYDVHDKGIVVKCKSVKELRKINSLAVAFYSTATDIPLWNIGRARIRAKDVSKDADIWSADFIEQARILQRANCLGDVHFIKANNNYACRWGLHDVHL